MCFPKILASWGQGRTARKAESFSQDHLIPCLLVLKACCSSIITQLSHLSDGTGTPRKCGPEDRRKHEHRNRRPSQAYTQSPYPETTKPYPESYYLFNLTEHPSHPSSTSKIPLFSGPHIWWPFAHVTVLAQVVTGGLQCLNHSSVLTRMSQHRHPLWKWPFLAAKCSCRLKGFETLFVKWMNRRRRGQIDRWTKSHMDTRWEGTNAPREGSQYLLPIPIIPHSHFPSNCFSPSGHLRVNPWIGGQGGRAWLRSWCWPPGRGLLSSSSSGNVAISSPQTVCRLCPLWNVSWLPSLNSSRLSFPHHSQLYASGLQQTTAPWN